MHTPESHKRRRSVRLGEHDYGSPGAYFVTIVTHQRACLFGGIVDGKMQLNHLGDIVVERWAELPHHFRRVSLDACVVMPNHVHGIVVIGDMGELDGRRGMACHAPTDRAPRRTFGNPPPDSLSSIVGSFKSAATRAINMARNTRGAPVWQRNYYEYIVRNNDDLNRIRAYIQANPVQWTHDELHTATP